MDGIPPPLDDDDDDVAWALQTAAVQWQRSAHADAVVWLHRAVDAAISAGKPERAHDLTVAAQELTQRLSGAAVAANPEPVSVGDRVSLSMDVEFAPPSEPVFEIPRRPPPPRRGAPPPPRQGGSLPIPKPPPPRSIAAAAAPALQPPPPPAQPAFPPVPVGMPAPEAKRPSSRPPAARYSRPPDVFEPLPERLKKSSQPPPPPTPPPPSVTSDSESDRDRAAFPYSQPPPPLDTSLGESIDALLAQVSDVSTRLGEAESTPMDAQPTAADSRPPSEVPSEPAPEPEPEPEREPEPATLPPAAEEPAPAAEEPPSAPSEPESVAARESIPPLVEGVSLADVRGLQDLPADAQAGLAEKARVEVLGPDEEIGGFAVALVLEGDVRIMPSIADVACAFAAKGEVVFTSGSLEDGVMLRVVAGDAGARVALWDPDALAEATASCPWVADELRLVADRYQALAGATMGAMGDRLDDALRSMVTSRCDVRLLLGGEVLLEPGKPVDGMYIVGAGRLELVVEGDVVDELGPGDFLFAEQILAAGGAPSVARAGKTGALLLFAPRMTAHELLVSVPPLLEILAG